MAKGLNVTTAKPKKNGKIASKPVGQKLTK